MREKIDADLKAKLAMNNDKIAADMPEILETSRKDGAHGIVLVMIDGELTPCRPVDEVGDKGVGQSKGFAKGHLSVREGSSAQAWGDDPAHEPEEIPESLIKKRGRR